MAGNALADLGRQGVAALDRQVVARHIQAEAICPQQLLAHLRRQGGGQQDDTATLASMSGQQLFQQHGHVAVVGMHFVDQQHLAGQSQQAQ
ncbi:hypothetical protein D9M70_400800 [compost metagenome]